MSEFEAAPAEDALDREREIWTGSQDTRARVRAVATGLHDPKTAGRVAERAECAPNTARKHLEDLVSLGVVRRVEGEAGTRYVRNEAYFRWREADDLAAANSTEALLDALADLESQEAEFQETFDAPTPAAVALPEEGTHADIEERLSTLSEWATVRRAIARHRDALRIAREDEERLAA